MARARRDNRLPPPFLKRAVLKDQGGAGNPLPDRYPFSLALISHEALDIAFT